MTSTFDDESPTPRNIELFDDEYFSGDDDDPYGRAASTTDFLIRTTKKQFSSTSNKPHDYGAGLMQEDITYKHLQVAKKTPMLNFKVLIDKFLMKLSVTETTKMPVDKNRTSTTSYHQAKPSSRKSQSDKNNVSILGGRMGKGKQQRKPTKSTRKKPSQVHPVLIAPGKKKSLLSRGWNQFLMVYKVSPPPNNHDHSTQSFRASFNVDSKRRGWHAGI